MWKKVYKSLYGRDATREEAAKDEELVQIGEELQGLKNKIAIGKEQFLMQQHHVMNDKSSTTRKSTTNSPSPNSRKNNSNNDDDELGQIVTEEKRIQLRNLPPEEKQNEMQRLLNMT